MKQTLLLHARYTGATPRTDQTGAVFRICQSLRQETSDKKCIRSGEVPKPYKKRQNILFLFSFRKLDAV